MNHRLYPLEGVRNFRDYGGYASRLGGRVVEGRLFRSGNPAKATASDIAVLDGLGVTSIVDMRRRNEREADPAAWPVGDASHVITGSDLDQPSNVRPPHLEHLSRGDLTAALAETLMATTYRDLPFVPRYMELNGAFLRRLADTPGGSLIYCTMGKDRTGILAALVLHILGVEREDILEDYDLTNAAIDLENNLDQVLDTFARNYAVRPSPEVVKPLLGVRKPYLEAAFDEMGQRHGSIDGYLAAIGADGDVRQRIREQYLEA